MAFSFFKLMWILNYVAEVLAKCCIHAGQCFAFVE